MCFVPGNIHVAATPIMLDFKQGVVRHQLTDDPATVYTVGPDGVFTQFGRGGLCTMVALIV